MLLQALRHHLANRTLAVGELVQFEWLVFRVAEVGPPVVLETPDFKALGSFTRDLSVAEHIVQQQLGMLHGDLDAVEPCTLRHTAIVSKSYAPSHPRAFIQRDAVARDHASGWYVGVEDDPLSMDDASSFSVRSLYELSIDDDRLTKFWLMPVGTSVVLSEIV